MLQAECFVFQLLQGSYVRSHSGSPAKLLATSGTIRHRPHSSEHHRKPQRLRQAILLLTSVERHVLLKRTKAALAPTYTHLHHAHTI